MSCANCRKPAKVTRQPSTPAPASPSRPPGRPPSRPRATNRLGDLKGAITGLRHGPK